MNLVSLLVSWFRKVVRGVCILDLRFFRMGMV